MSKILVVEDDTSIQALLHDFLGEVGYRVVFTAPRRSSPPRRPSALLSGPTM